MDAINEIQENQIVGKKYRVVKLIGKGAFGKVWRAINEITNTEVAIKFEDRNSTSKQLYYEFQLYKYFHSDHSIISQGIP